MRVRIFSRAFVLTVLLPFVISAHSQPSIQVLHNHLRPVVSSGQAALVGKLPPEQRLNLSIVLPLRDQSELTSLLSRLYDPSSPEYRHFLTVEQFTQQFSPTVEDYQAVVGFARAHGLAVTDTPANRMLVPLSGTVAQVEKALNVQMNNYRHPTEDRTFFSPDREPSLALSVPVAHIAGLDNFSIPRPMVMKAAARQAIASVTGSGPGCPAQLQNKNECYGWDGSSYLSSDMRAAYYGGTALTGTGQTVGLMQFDGYNICDVISTFAGVATLGSCVDGVSNNGSSYQLTYTPIAGGMTYNLPINNVLIDGATGTPGQFLPPADDAEQALDIVQAIGMAPGLSQVRVYIGYSDADILNAMAAEDLAQQLSISWVWSPADPSTDDFIFLELAAQGQSVFAASGDWGAFDAAYPAYFPAEDAWVTAVGGTSLTTNGASGSWNSETAWSRSGGGVSPDGIPIPSWQAGLASASNNGSTTLRNVPDVAMEADFDNYACDMGVCYGYYAGTSFAAPRWAGFMALVNQQTTAAGNPTVGLLTPAIYPLGEGASYSSDFHDILSGNNYYVPFEPYFNAVPGYDLVTGWGSPEGQNLIDALAPPASVGFQLSASPNSLVVDLGTSSTTTITVKDVGGFTGSVNLSVSGLPSGITGSFDTNPAAGSSVLTLSANSSAIRGSYLVTITGVSGTITAKNYLALEVNAPGFSIAPISIYMTVIPGYTVTNAIAVTSFAGFTGSVSLAVTSALPAGLTTSWSSDPITGWNLLTVAASDTFQLPVGGASIPVTITVAGTSGAESEITSISLFVSPPAFFLSLVYPDYYLVPGGSFSTTVDLAPWGNFTEPITLITPQLPPGVTSSFNPNPTTTFRSVLTMTASSTAPLGRYQSNPIRGEGASGGWSDSEFSLAVTAVPTPFATLDVSPPSLTIAQGGSSTATVTLTGLNGFTSDSTLGVNVSPVGVDAPLDCGVTASFDPNPTTGTSLLTLTVSDSAPPGFDFVNINNDYILTTLMLYVAPAPGVINPSPGFTLNASPISLTLAQGASVPDTITMIPVNGFTSSVNLSASGLPSGVTVSFVPNPTTGTSVLRLTASSTAIAGPATVTATGTSGNLSASTSIALTVKLPPSFTLSALPSSLTIVQGKSASSTVSVTGDWGFAGTVTLSALNLPSGVTAAWGTNPTSGSSLLTLTASSTAVTGPAVVTIQGESPTVCGFVCDYISAITTISLTVNVPPSFTLSASPPSLTIAQGRSGSSTISVIGAGGFTDAVTLAASNLPSGVTATWGTNPTTSSSLLTLTAGSTAVIGPATLTMTGTSGSLTSSTTIALTINAPPSFALSASPLSFTFIQGSSGSSTISVTPAGGFTGNVSLTAAVTSSPTGAQNLPTWSFGTTSPVTIAGTTAGTATLVISTTPATSGVLIDPKHPGVSWYTTGGATLAYLLLLGIPARRRRWLSMLACMVLLAALAVGLLACNRIDGEWHSSPVNNGTTPGAYTITITGTSALTSSTAVVNLNVQ